MTRWQFAAVAVMGLLFLVGLRLCSPPALAGGDGPAAAPLSGRPVFLMAKDNVSFTLDKVEIRQMGDRAFVVGRETDDESFRLTKQLFGGGTVWVPVDNITQLVELEPVEREN